jgi:hypothetical protein
VTSASASAVTAPAPSAARATSLGQIGDHRTHRDRQNGCNRDAKPPEHERLPRPY